MRARVNANGVRLYEYNSTISPAKGFLANGEEIEIKAEYGGWCQLMDGRWVEACYTEAIEVSGGGVTSWNDLTDKPFGEGVRLVETVLLEETTGVGSGVWERLNSSLVEGETYLVTWDGVDYECVARNYSGYIMLGNNAIYEHDGDDETDTGEPFAIEAEAVNTWCCFYVNKNDEETHTVRISQKKREVHKIDEKYLPENAVNITDDNVSYELCERAFVESTTGRIVTFNGVPCLLVDGHPNYGSTRFFYAWPGANDPSELCIMLVTVSFSDGEITDVNHNEKHLVTTD